MKIESPIVCGAGFVIGLIFVILVVDIPLLVFVGQTEYLRPNIILTSHVMMIVGAVIFFGLLELFRRRH